MTASPTHAKKAIVAASSGDILGISRLVKHILDTQDFDVTILDAILPFLQDFQRPPKKAYLEAKNPPPGRASEAGTRHRSDTLQAVERARLSASIIVALCDGCLHEPMRQEIAQKLCLQFSSLVQWVDIFQLAGFVQDSASLLSRLWKFNPAITRRMQESTTTVRIVLMLWYLKDTFTRRYVFDRTGRCPLIQLLLDFSRDAHCKDIILGLLHFQKKKGISLIASGFRVRMKEIADRHAAGTMARQFAVTHLVDMANILHTLLPCDGQRYWVKLISKQQLLLSMFTSLSTVMHLDQHDVCWSWAAKGLVYLEHFILKSGKYSGSPVSKMADAVRGDVIQPIVGCLLSLHPSHKGHGTAITILQSIGGYLLYRPVWEMARSYLPKNGVDILLPQAVEKLRRNSELAYTTWVSFQKALSMATGYHTGKTAQSLRLHGCDNLKDFRSTKKAVLITISPFHVHDNAQNVTLSSIAHTSANRRSGRRFIVKNVVDILSYVEGFCNTHYTKIQNAASNANPGTGDFPFIIALHFASIPYTLAIAPSQDYLQALPQFRLPTFRNRVEAYLDHCLGDPGNQLVELHFMHGVAPHLAIIRLQDHKNGSFTVISGVFGF
ncbi:hypothetical protein H1R20_g5542, partial [Candolleomyces eurysporus]